MAPDKPGTVCPECHAVSGYVDDKMRPDRHTVRDNGAPCSKKGQVA